MYDRRMRRSIAVLAGLVLFGCTTSVSVDDAGIDASVDDAWSRPDAGSRPDAWVRPMFDTSSTWRAAPLACPSGPARRDPRNLGTQRRFALSVLHYNIQYVAGGLAGVEIGGREPFPDWSDDRVQDAIVTQSLVPVLDLLDAHPSWTISIEMQGYFVEVLLARHRAVAQHLSDLVRSGQVELLSFHYSDQLFLAYPRQHMDRSHALGDRVLADGCVAASGPVFTQEGQFGEGMASVLGSGGDDVILLPKNLFSFQHGDGDVAPVYTTHGVPVVIAGRGVNDTASGFSSVWIYMDDAEKLATNGLDPYVGSSFVVDPASVTAFESQLVALEASGYVIAGVGDWVATLHGAGVTPVDLPPTLDGTWQPNNTENVARWMGNTGAFAATERDNAVLTGNSIGGRMVLAAEVAAATAATMGHAVPGADAEVDRAWRDLLLGEVSDATGWNPARTEVYYGVFHGQAAASRARAVAVSAAAALGISPPFVVDTLGGSIVAASMEPPTVLEDDPSPPFMVDPGRSRRYTSRWQRVVGQADHHVLTIDVAAASGAAQVVMPWSLDHVRYTPAMLDGTSVDLPLTDFTLTTIAIAINDGPLGLATNQWLILDTSTIALAARLDPAMHTVTFRDASLPESETDQWVFHVATGSIDRALAVTDRLNLHPHVRIDAP